MATTDGKSNKKASKPDDKSGGDPKDVATNKPRGEYPQDQSFTSERTFPEQAPPQAPPIAGRPNSDPLSVPADTMPAATEYGQPHSQNVPGQNNQPKTQRDVDENRR